MSSTVSRMMKNVKERAGQEQRVRQKSKSVRAMLGHEKKTDDSQKSEQCYDAARARQVSSLPLMIGHLLPPYLQAIRTRPVAMC